MTLSREHDPYSGHVVDDEVPEVGGAGVPFEPVTPPVEPIPEPAPEIAAETPAPTKRPVKRRRGRIPSAADLEAAKAKL
jgi:hypothetical protein